MKFKSVAAPTNVGMKVLNESEAVTAIFLQPRKRHVTAEKKIVAYNHTNSTANFSARLKKQHNFVNSEILLAIQQCEQSLHFIHFMNKQTKPKETVSSPRNVPSRKRKTGIIKTSAGILSKAKEKAELGVN